MDWISVNYKDKSPEVGEHILVCLDFGIQTVMVFSNLSEFKSPFHEHSSWSGSVTHWMPIPKPPKDQS